MLRNKINTMNESELDDLKEELKSLIQLKNSETNSPFNNIIDEAIKAVEVDIQKYQNSDNQPGFFKHSSHSEFSEKESSLQQYKIFKLTISYYIDIEDSIELLESIKYIDKSPECSEDKPISTLQQRLHNLLTYMNNIYAKLVMQHYKLFEAFALTPKALYEKTGRTGSLARNKNLKPLTADEILEILIEAQIFGLNIVSKTTANQIEEMKSEVTDHKTKLLSDMRAGKKFSEAERVNHKIHLDKLQDVISKIQQFCDKATSLSANLNELSQAIELLTNTDPKKALRN